MSGKSIEATLRLETTPFIEALNKTKTEVNTFRNSLLRMGKDSPQVEQGILRIQQALSVLIPYLNRFKNLAESNKAFKQFANGLKSMSEAVMNFSNVTKTSQVGILRVQQIIKEWSNAVRNLTVNVKGVIQAEQQEVSTLNQLRSAYNSTYMASQKLIIPTKQYDSAIGPILPKQRDMIINAVGLTNALNQESSAMEKDTNSTKRNSQAKNEATASTQRLSSANKMLGNSLNMLKNAFTLVGSMIAYNFIHNLGQATTQTINAKSEMNAYFDMLGYSTTQVKDFNSALDETVAKFPRLNKYSLGETISSLGVEFNLTTEQMKEAMPVVSMITSEYLRAGRNVNEASLAVKDILQGEFQRLSRETGVGEDELIEAGWSGDTSDVMGLLDALDKVGKSRHWDTFVTKAGSLNDAILILQNRFGEWSADVVEKFQPRILDFFNRVMEHAQSLATAFDGVWKWLSGDGLGQSIVKWGGLATAILGVVTAITMYRTGANLLQVVRMGLLKSIGASILGLNGESVANYGLLNSIVASTTGIDAEVVAREGKLTAIAMSVSGLEAEQVAEIGATKTIVAYALGVDMATLSQEGLLVAILETTTGMEASQIASMGMAKKIALLTATTLPAIVTIGAFAVAVGGLVIQMNQSAEVMENFNDLVENGQDKMEEARETVRDLSNQKQQLQDKLDGLEKGTSEYNQTAQELTQTTHDLDVATYNWKNTIQAVQRASSAHKNFEDRKNQLMLQHQDDLAQAYMRAGYSAEDSFRRANESMNDAERGADNLRRTLQKIAVLDFKHLETVNDLIGTSNETSKKTIGAEFGVTGENATKHIVDKKLEPYLDSADYAHSVMERGLTNAMTSDSFIGIMDGWATYYYGQILNYFNNIGAKWDMGDLYGVLEDAFWGLMHGFADLPFFKDFWSGVFDMVNLDKYAHRGWDGLKEFLYDSFINPDDLKWGWDPFNDLKKWYKDSIMNLANMIDDWWSDAGNQISQFGSDMGKNIDGFGKWIGDSIHNADLMITQGLKDFADGFWDGLVDLGEMFKNNIITPITDALGGFNLFDAIWNAITGGDDGSGEGGTGSTVPMSLNISNWISSLADGIVQGVQSLGTTVSALIGSFGQTLMDGLSSIPLVGTLMTLFSTLTDENVGASEKARLLGEVFRSALENVVRNIPILSDILQVLGVIPQANPTASSNGYGVGKSIFDGVKNGISGMVSHVLGELQRIVDGIKDKAQDAYNSAKDFGTQIWNGMNSKLQIFSPGFIHDKIMEEFGTYIPSAIQTSASNVYGVAQSYGQSIIDGVGDVGSSMGIGGVADEYQTDAQIISTSSQMMGLDTTTAFNEMGLAVSSNTGQMVSDVANTYTSIQSNQASSLQQMKTSNTSAYNDMYLKSNQSLIQMRDSTSNITTQMTRAWMLMKDNIVASANQLKSDSTVHFNQLSDTIGSFYRKIQNPSNWGSAGSPTLRQGTPRPSVGRRIVRSGFAGSPSWTGNRTMSVGALKNILCPNGDCGSLFDNFSSTDVVDVETFLMSITGEHGFGWGDWNKTHYNHIKTKSDAWDTGSPVFALKGGIPTSTKFKVGDFNNGTPTIQFGEFKSMAESLFSAIPYRFYYDSSWKGSWLGALQAGACNCWDGANALIALANTCGFSGSIESGTWANTGIPHVWARINGVKMDTTAWQQRGTWSAGGTRNTPKMGNEVHINVNMTGNTIYGVDDLEDKITEGVKKGLQEEFNDPYTVAI